MAYLGQQPISGNFIKLDTISVVNGQATYSMQRSSVNYSPASANHMIVSLNGIIQNPGSSYTISAHQITFASNLVTGDVIDFIMVLGDVLNVGTVSDSTITNDKLSTAPTLISKGGGGASGAIQLNCENNSHGVKVKGPPHSAAQSYTLTLPSTAPAANKMLQSDGSGNLSFVDAPSGGLNKISTTTVSSAVSSVDFPTIGTDYKFYKLVFTDLHASTSDLFSLRFTNDNGSSYLAASQYDFCSQNGKNGSNTQYASNGSNRVIFGYWNFSTYSGHASHGEINFSNPANSSNYASVEWSIKYTDTSNIPVHSYGVGHYRQGTPMTGFQILPASGNIEAGIFTVYGLES